eukprot:scaffold218437_cov28-Tisochrysis_lutea.AAC.6
MEEWPHARECRRPPRSRRERSDLIGSCFVLALDKAQSLLKVHHLIGAESNPSLPALVGVHKGQPGGLKVKNEDGTCLNALKLRKDGIESAESFKEQTTYDVHLAVRHRELRERTVFEPLLCLSHNLIRAPKRTHQLSKGLVDVRDEHGHPPGHGFERLQDFVVLAAQLL